jgi:hypothetical protein
MDEMGWIDFENTRYNKLVASKSDEDKGIETNATA